MAHLGSRDSGFWESGCRATSHAQGGLQVVYARIRS